VGVTQVMPYPWSVGTAVVKEYREAKNETTSYLSLEGFVSAKVLVEGLKRAGPNLNRGGFVLAMESMRDYHVGGFHVSYAPDDRDGLRFIEVTVTGQEGKFLRELRPANARHREGCGGVTGSRPSPLNGSRYKRRGFA
jgi:branched-chain amino acid transport system substrate-binding protein